MAKYKITVEGTEYEAEVVEGAAGQAQVTVEGQTFAIEPVAGAVTTPVAAPIAAAPPLPAAPRPAAPVAAGAGDVVAPIPGVITKVLVKVGDPVQAGQTVVKLEAMKMENDIACATAGTVKEVAVREGSEVADGQLLVAIG
jgi:biotin carboxyl carrier protein